MPPRDVLPTSNPQHTSPHNSSTPLISDRQRQDLQNGGTTQTTAFDEKESRSLKRRLLELAGKKEDERTKEGDRKNEGDWPNMEAANAAAFETAAGATDAQAASPLAQHQQVNLKPQVRRAPVSPSRLPYHSAISASPSRLRSSSPRLHSPASSEIFERNVQEPIPISTLSNELTEAHIPAHVMTEDDIPPALDASTEAITSKLLNPDEVEIVMSASHQPAAASVLDASASHADLMPLPSPLRHETSVDTEPASLQASGILQNLDDDVASSYGQLDPTDVRRLSFISFKDIMHSEHQQQHQQQLAGLSEAGNRDSLHIGGHSFSSSINERATSPLRSPRSPVSTHSQINASGGLTTPPPSTTITNPLAEQSPVRLGSPGSLHGPSHGELTIETMRQSIRKTASGDLGNVRHRDGSDGIRSAGMSPVGDENDLRRQAQSRSRTNS